MGQLWQRKFWKPITARGGKILATLDDARIFVLKLDGHRQLRHDWQVATGALMQAADGGSVDFARAAFKDALSHDRLLNVQHEQAQRRKGERGRDHSH